MKDSGFGVEIDEDGHALAIGPEWHRDLGWVQSTGPHSWTAKHPDHSPALADEVASRRLAVQSLVRHAGLGGDFVIRDA